MSFRISEPRALQLKGVAKRWYPLLLKVLKSEKDTLKIQPIIRANYRLKMTEVPKLYTGEDIKVLEEPRSFRLVSLPRQDVDNYLALTSDDCCIILFSRPESFKNNENTVIDRLNLSLSMKLKIYEFSLESDPQLQLVKKDKRDGRFEFERPEVTLIRKHQRLLDIEDRVHDKQASAIATAVTEGMISVIKQVKEEEKVKVKEEEYDDWENLMPPMTSRRHSADSLQNGGARARPPTGVRPRGGAYPIIQMK